MDGFKNNKKTLDYALGYTKPLQEVCEPLFNSFNLTTFGYKRIKKNGQYLFVSTNEDWLRFHYQNIGGHGRFFKSIMDKTLKVGFERAVWPKEPKDDFLKSLFIHDMSNGINFYKLNGEVIELWTFSTDKEAHQDSNSYVEIINCLEKFISYFNGKCYGIIENLKEDNYATLCGKIGIESLPPPIDNNDDLSKIERFLKSLDSETISIDSNQGFISLTKRQRECLEQLSLGKTNKEIARDLNISPRTVEDHIDTIKQKGDFYTRSEIISQYYKSLFIKNF